jgi:hypothetical protein
MMSQIQDARLRRRIKGVVFCIGVVLILGIPSCRIEQIERLALEPIRLNTLPPRPKDAITGSEFARRTAWLSVAQQQREALKELRSGNIPEFLRDLKPVHLSHTFSGGETITAIIWVMPDYLAIGPDEDFLRIPLTYPSATAIANEFGCILPTRKMVDTIYEQSAIHLEPQPLPPGRQMRTSAYYLRHQQKIDAQYAHYPLGDLVSGHKKDVVLTNLLHRNRNRIAIYGWHQLNGEPIQPLSIVHGAKYADYSHGIRLVYQTVWIDGANQSIFEILQDPVLAPVLTYEGVIADPRSLMQQK